LGSAAGTFFDFDSIYNYLMDSYKTDMNRARTIAADFEDLFMLPCGGKQHDRTQGNYNMIYDPQGVVYDGTLDYPVKGVRAELWTATDGTGVGERYWSEAADYDQINPQITEDDGMFQWFTPEGWWQVRIYEWDEATKTKGAFLGGSAWLKVLPPHFGVNINIGGEPVTVTYEGNGGELPLGNFFDPDDPMAVTDIPQTSFQVPVGKNHTAIANPYTNTGKTFSGWNTKADGTGTAYAAGATISNVQADITLYAQWKTGDTPGGNTGGGGGGTTTVPPTYPPQAFINPFDDVFETDWFYDDVAWAYVEGLMKGTSETKFSPRIPLTRAMIVTILYRQEGEPSAAGLPNPFSDVMAGTWYTDAVKWAADKGIVLGYPDWTFKPTGDVTRQELAVILHRYAGFKGIELPGTVAYAPFADDGDIAVYAKDAIEALYKAGVINGKPGNKFDPIGKATRAETAAMLHRFLGGAEEG
jgi:hypothetical protein